MIKGAAPSNRIETLAFDLHVTQAAPSINSPDRLLLAIREELLETCDQVLADAGATHAPVHIGDVTLDIGQFDTPIDWDLVRARLRDGLVSAIHPYLTPRKPQEPSAQFTGQKLAQLRAMAAARGLPVSGPKSALIARLAAHAERPWDFAAKTLKRAQTVDDLTLCLTGTQNPSISVATETIRKMTPQDVQTALRITVPKTYFFSDNYSAKLVQILTGEHTQDTHAAPNVDPPQSPLDHARARYCALFHDGVGLNSLLGTDTPENAQIISYLPSTAQLDAALNARIAPDATHLLQAVGALNDAPDPEAAKRHILAALIANAPVDTIAARAVAYDPAIAAQASFARAMLGLGDDMPQSLAGAAHAAPEAPCKQALAETLGHAAQGFLEKLELIYSALRPALPAEPAHLTLFWGALTETILAKADLQSTELLSDFIARLIPDATKRDIALRGTIARLHYPAVASAKARAEARALLETLLRPEITAPQPISDGSPRIATQVAGLVLFHPYIAMLFDRLEVQRDGAAITPAHLPIAQAALVYLALGDTGQSAANDPLYDCLLGRAIPAEPLPVHGLTPGNHALIDGLVQSVIAQWGRLGNTSADGLRAAFVQRGGVLDLDDPAQAKLTVNKGAYDMLLDGLPWAFQVIALPWMPAPLHVDWRQRDE